MLMSSLLLNADLSRYQFDHSERFSRRRGTTTNTPTTIYSPCTQSVASLPLPFLKGLGDTIACCVSYNKSPSSRGCSVLVIDHVTDLPLGLYPDKIPADAAFNILQFSH